MATGAGTDDLVLAGYFDLKLTGLDSLKFTDVSGLTQSISVSGEAVGSSTGGAADGRVVGPPQPLTLTMQHVVITSMDLWTGWLNPTIETKAGSTAKKSGTLELMPMGGGSPVALKTWSLDDVYLTSVSLDQMGAGAASHLTASIEILVGQCIAQ